MGSSKYLTHVLDKIRREPVAGVLLQALEKVNIRIQPYYLYEEGLFLSEAPVPNIDIGSCEVRSLGPADMPAVAAVPFRDVSEVRLRGHLEEGLGCLGLRVQGELAAFNWYDLANCRYRGCPFRLREDEAYLFDAFTLSHFRGKGVAPFLRYRLYQFLSENDRIRFYSISDRFNLASIRFKQKLKARSRGRGLYINLFGRRQFTWPPEWVVETRSGKD